MSGFSLLGYPPWTSFFLLHVNWLIHIGFCIFIRVCYCNSDQIGLKSGKWFENEFLFNRYCITIWHLCIFSHLNLWFQIYQFCLGHVYLTASLHVVLSSVWFNYWFLKPWSWRTILIWFFWHVFGIVCLFFVLFTNFFFARLIWSLYMSEHSWVFVLFSFKPFCKISLWLQD